jgi:hypothetical protein
MGRNLASEVAPRILGQCGEGATPFPGELEDGTTMGEVRRQLVLAVVRELLQDLGREAVWASLSFLELS